MTHPLTACAAALAAATCVLTGCADLDINRGVYEATRSRERTTSPGEQRARLPPYDRYERERGELKSGSPAPAGAAASASKP